LESYFKVIELENRREKDTEESLMEQNGNLSKRNGQKTIRRVRQFSKEPTAGMKKLHSIQSNI
jgi:hypothetical protein